MSTEAKEKTYSVTLAEEVYKNLRMSIDSMLTVMPKVKDAEFKSKLTGYIDRAEKLSSDAAAYLHENGGELKEENLLTRTGAKLGIQMNTLADPSLSHIAEMMIQGMTMGVTDITGYIHDAEEAGVRASDRALTLARAVVEFEENANEEFKKYL